MSPAKLRSEEAIIKMTATRYSESLSSSYSLKASNIEPTNPMSVSTAPTRAPAPAPTSAEIMAGTFWRSAKQMTHPKPANSATIKTRTPQKYPIQMSVEAVLNSALALPAS